MIKETVVILCILDVYITERPITTFFDTADVTPIFAITKDSISCSLDTYLDLKRGCFLVSH